MFQSLKTAGYDLYKKTVENVVPPPKYSQFKETGKLTPEEFVLAGDFLVQTCPTWSWDGGDAAKQWSFLPSDKQYLITRNVPCLQRASSVLFYSENVNPKSTGEDVEGGDWVATSSADQVNQELDSFEELPDLIHGRYKNPSDDIPDADDGEGEGEGTHDHIDPSLIPDITNDDDDDDAVAPRETTTTAPQASKQSGVLLTRTFDVLISYDNYYHVPRVWLLGYAEDKTPLTKDEILEDVIGDYFTQDRKTVSVEDHPHRVAGGKVVSIHPCRHANVMHKLTSVVTNSSSDDNGDVLTNREFKIEHYMVLFLKFISSVVPTIEYDYTMPAGL